MLASPAGITAWVHAQAGSDWCGACLFDLLTGHTRLRQCRCPSSVTFDFDCSWLVHGICSQLSSRLAASGVS